MTTTNHSNEVEAVPHHVEGDSFDLKPALIRILETAITYWWILVATPLLTLVCVFTYIMIWPPTYQAAVGLLSEAEKDYERVAFYRNWNTFRKDDLNSEVQLMTSRPVLQDVVEQLGLTYEEIYHPPLSHLTYLWTESRIGDEYRRIKALFFPKKESPFELSDEEKEMGRILVDLKSGVRLDPVPDSFVAALVVKSASPRAAEIANALAHTYLKHRKIRYEAEARKAYDSLKIEVDIAREQLNTIDNERIAYAEGNGLFLDLENGKVEIGLWENLGASILELESQLKGLRQKRLKIDEDMSHEPERIVSSEVFQVDENYRIREAQYHGLITQRELGLLRYLPDSPELATINNQIDALSGLIDSAGEEKVYSRTSTINATYQNLYLTLKNIDADIAGIEATLIQKRKEHAIIADKLRTLPEKKVTLHNIDRQRTQLEEKFTALSQKLKIAEVSITSLATAPSAIQVVEYATVPNKPVWPKTKLLIAAAIFLGLAGGLILAVAVDMVFPRFSINNFNNSKEELPFFAEVVLGGKKSKVNMLTPHTFSNYAKLEKSNL